MIGILVDTSIIIDYLRQKDKNQTILFKLGQKKFKLYASIITLSECYAGKSIWEKKEAMKALKTIFSGIKILSLEENISEKAGRISAKNGIDLLDAIVAATSIIHGLDLATLNIKDFKKVDGIKLFKERVRH